MFQVVLLEVDARGNILQGLWTDALEDVCAKIGESNAIRKEIKIRLEDAKKVLDEATAVYDEWNETYQ